MGLTSIEILMKRIKRDRQLPSEDAALGVASEPVTPRVVYVAEQQNDWRQFVLLVLWMTPA
jgi:hypothetical protein